jgi:hypothetical protein
MLLFCRSWIAFVSLRKVRGLRVFLPILKLIIGTWQLRTGERDFWWKIASLVSGFDLDILRRLLSRTRGRSHQSDLVLPRQPTWTDRGRPATNLPRSRWAQM